MSDTFTVGFFVKTAQDELVASVSPLRPSTAHRHKFPDSNNGPLTPEVYETFRQLIELLRPDLLDDLDTHVRPLTDQDYRFYMVVTD